MSLTSFEPTKRQTRSQTLTPSTQLDLITSVFNKATNIVVFTGAGVSADSGIPTYRDVQSQEQLAEFTIAKLAQTEPNEGHYALQQLVATGVVNWVITTNIDGLHIKSGITDDHLIELHGSVYTAVCPNPGCRRITRFPTPVCTETPQTLTDGTASLLETPYVCDLCGSGPLRCTAVSMRTPLNPSILKHAEDVIKNSDLCFTIGTSLMVNPAAQLPFLANKVAICALNNTSFDHHQKCVCKITLPATQVLKTLRDRICNPQ